MKRIIGLCVLAMSAACAAPPAALAQQNMGQMGQMGQMGGMSQMGGMGGMGARMYDTRTVETIRGDIIAIEKVAYRGSRAYGIHLLLKTAAGNVSVHLGPSWYIARQHLKLAPDEMIEVTGSRVTYEGQPIVIAAEIRKGHQSMMLRDSRGFPLWSRSRQR